MKNTNNRYKVKTKKVTRPVNKGGKRKQAPSCRFVFITGACSDSFTESILEYT